MVDPGQDTGPRESVDLADRHSELGRHLRPAEQGEVLVEHDHDATALGLRSTPATRWTVSSDIGAPYCSTAWM